MMKLMLPLKVHLRIQFKEPLKMHKKVTKRMHSIGDATEGSSEGTPKVVP